MSRKRIAAWAALGILVTGLAVLAAGCGGGDDSSSSADWQVEGLGSTLDEIEANAKNEGQVNMVIWAGYADKSWADAFTQQTGCKVQTKDGASSDDMVDLIGVPCDHRSGGCPPLARGASRVCAPPREAAR